MKTRLNTKVCIVTGGAQGIGQSCCEFLAKEGAVVAVLDNQAAAGQAVVDQLQTAGHIAEFWPLDVGDEAAVQHTMAEVVARFGRVDVLVNNAGIEGANKPTHLLTEAEWDAVQRVNVKGVLFCTKHVIPYMLERKKGSIVNISSIYGIVGAPDIPPYHASKAAVRIMTKTDALYYAPHGIRVNSVHPGYIRTAMVEAGAVGYPGGIDAFLQQLATSQPLGFLGEPQDVAYAVVYLASEESRFVTGTELVIDGGYTCR
jgi:NAD(P)-dependent dehydrogenase (short-subunit alcohol dehydrogenase family)